MIYFVTDGTYIKVGFTTNLKNRLNTMSVFNARKLTVLAVADGELSDEQLLHKALKYNVKGEWFLPSRQLLDLIYNINSVARNETGAIIQSYLTDFVEAKNKELITSIAEGDEIERKFRENIKALIEEMMQKYGARFLAKHCGITPSAFRFSRTGASLPSALIIAKMGLLEPEKVRGLFSPAKVQA